MEKDLPNDESTEERHIKTVEITLSPANLNKKAKYFSIKRYFNLSNIVYFLVILACLLWCSFNIYSVLHEYLNHNTIVFLEFYSPKETRPPAISICTQCILCSYVYSIF